MQNFLTSLLAFLLGSVTIFVINVYHAMQDIVRELKQFLSCEGAEMTDNYNGSVNFWAKKILVLQDKIIINKNGKIIVNLDK